MTILTVAGARLPNPPDAGQRTAAQHLRTWSKMLASGRVKVAFRPNDIASLFQDSAGTTPVTAVEQPVGLILDKSKGLVLGPELVVSQDLTTWTSGGAFGNWGSSTATASVLTSTSTSGSRYIRFACTPGTTITASAMVSRAGIATNAWLAIVFGTSGNVYTSEVQALTTSTSPTQLRVIGTAPSNAAFCEIVVRADGASGSQATFTDISAKELPGNHASQATSTKRTTYSRRVNLLINTDTPSTPAWSTAVASMTGGNLVPSAALGVHTASQSVIAPGDACVKFTAKQNGYTRIMLRDASITGNFVLFDLVSGSIISNSVYTGSINPSISVAGGFDCTVNLTGKTSASEILSFVVGNSSTVSYATTYFTADGISGVLISKVSLVSGIDAHLPYQRVNTATDYDDDPNKFPAYLAFDVVDDALSTGNIDFTSTDKITVWAGVTKLSDAAVGVVVELSSSSSSKTRAFCLFAPDAAAARYAFRSRGELIGTDAVIAGYASPVTSVLAGVGDIAGDSQILRINGTQVASSTTDQGTGNYGNYPLYIGARAGTSLYFNGRLYGLIVLADLATADELAAVEYLLTYDMRLPA